MPNAFAHVELNTDDPKRATKFYRALFDWKLKAMPGMDYTMIDVGTGTGGGMQKNPMPNAPASWLPYVTVDDVKKTLVKARKAGAKIALDYTEIGEMGAIGVFVDPAGAALGVWQPGAGAASAAATTKKAARKAPAKKATKAAKPAATKAKPKKKATKKR